MPMFLCRWPNGEFSIVSAATKADAVEFLDELGNAEYAKLIRMTECMFDFRLNDLGEIELIQAGENTEEFIMEKCYPELGRVLADAETDNDKTTPPLRWKRSVLPLGTKENGCLRSCQKPRKPIRKRGGRYSASWICRASLRTALFAVPRKRFCDRRKVRKGRFNDLLAAVILFLICGPNGFRINPERREVQIKVPNQAL